MADKTDGKHREPAGRWLSMLHRCSHSYLGRRLEPLGMGPGQISFLIRVYFHEGISQDELAAELHIDKGTTARALQHLEKNGFIERRRDPVDGRVNRIYPTPKAREVRPVLRRILHEWNEILFREFPEDERDHIVGALRRMAANAAAALDEARGRAGS